MAEKIGVIGSGVVGKTLASGFVKHAIEVMIGRHLGMGRGTWR
jgi:predicted dinucleotide-binding enzyme